MTLSSNVMKPFAMAVALALTALGAVAFGAAAPAAEGPPTDAIPLDDAKFMPGQEVKIIDPSLGKVGYYVIYVPKEYTPARTWPAVFCYHGKDQHPTTSPFKPVLGGSGFVVIGMCYYGGRGLEAFGTVLKDIDSVQRLAPILAKKLNLDPRQLFIGGFSEGGWMTGTISEATLPLWVGIAITGAGRQGGSPRDAAALQGKPIYIGIGEKDPSHDAAVKASEWYRSHGADVTFETYANLAHAVDTKSKVFADWLWSSGPLKQVKGDLAQARALQVAGKLGLALAKYQQIAAVPGGQPPIVEAREAAEAIVKEAEPALAAAEEAASAKRYPEAIAAFSKLAVAYNGSTLGERARKGLDALKGDPAVQGALDKARVNAEAKALMEQAQAAETAKEYAKAIKLYEQLVAGCAGADCLGDARKRLEALKSDKSVTAAVRGKEAERECRSWLSMADNFLAAERPDKAREYLQKIVDKYGDTEWGQQAKERIKKLK